MAHVSQHVGSKYFLDALNLFSQMKWLYNAPVTEILTRRLLDELPKEWLNFLLTLKNEELNNLVAKKIVKAEWPKTFKDFVEKCKDTDRLPFVNTVPTVHLPKNFRTGLTCKKQHEIVHLAHLVHAQCALQGINLIIDLGAGLGYVCQLLYHLYGYKVLGLEKSQANVNNARNRQQKLYPESLTHVKYDCCDLTSDSAMTIERIVQNEFHETTDICLIGLHACGDLSIYASKIFLNLKGAKIFIMMSCCYHKLSLSTNKKKDVSDENQYFHNFPLSHCFRNTIDASTFNVDSFLRQPFLRLASQEPADRWNHMSLETHNEHSFYVLARAVLQLYATNNGFILEKQVQKGTRKSQCQNFETYINDSLLRYTLKAKTKEQDEGKGEQNEFEVHKENIMELWEHHCTKLKIVELYSGLQLMLQASAESLVLQDRLHWMQEQGLDAVIIPVMNKCLSPRSCAIVSRKR